MAGLSDLAFQPGLDFQELIKQRFRVPVSPISSSSVFFLIASFNRSAIRLDVDSLSLILQGCLGGIAADFNVSCFRFSVSYKNVGLLTHRLKVLSTKHYSVHSTLWRDGGQNWQRELAIWETRLGVHLHLLVTLIPRHQSHPSGQAHLGSCAIYCGSHHNSPQS
jgi:hypothetical protein